VLCRFSTGTLSVPTEPTPASTPPAGVQGAPGWSTVAAGEPAPGVFLELHLPTTRLVASTLVTPEFQLRNTSTDQVSLSNGVSVLPDGQDQASNGAQPDPRAFPMFATTGPPGAFEARVPAGQTQAVMAMAQVPFDASRPVHLQAAAGISIVTPNAFIPRRVASVLADIPVRLDAATSAEHLALDLQADRQQWCLKATDASGGRPTGPLFIRRTASGDGGTLMGSGVPGGTGDAWAQRWSRSGSPDLFQGTSPLTLVVWVAGPHYVTARPEITIPASP
jgi:hypothetical protein